MTVQDPDSAIAKPTSASNVAGGARRVAAWRMALTRFFLLPDALERARAGHFKRDDPGFAEFCAARDCLDAGQNLDVDVWPKLEGLALLRVALPLALDAWRARRKLVVPRQLRPLWTALAEHPDAQKYLKQLTSQEKEVIDRFLDDTDPISVAGMSSEDREVLGRILVDIVRRLLDGLQRETVSENQIKAHRLFRVVLIPLGVVLVLLVSYKWFTRPMNWAFNMPVQLSSSFKPEIYPAAALVNGDTHALAIHTMHEEQPWAQIDLGKKRKIQRIEVFNRQDLRQNSVPLRIETSPDGKHFKAFANKEAEFLHWTAEGTPVAARYVRLTVTRLSSLQLAEVEVY